MRVWAFMFLAACGGQVQPSQGDAADAGVPEVVQQPTVSGSVTFTNGSFSALFASGDQNVCTSGQTSGACAISTCDGNLLKGISAGTLALTGGTFDGAQVTAGANGLYVADGTFKGGDVLGVSASGADVPAFGPTTIVAPAMIALTSPQPTTISTASDLVITWAGGEQGAKVIVEITTGTQSSLGCSFDATAGTGTVPQVLLAQLQGQNGQFGWGQSRSASIVVSGVKLEMGALQIQTAQVSFQ